MSVATKKGVLRNSRFPVWLLSFLLYWNLAIPSFALSASEILSRARTYLKDQSSSATRQIFSDTTLLGFLNDGQREANAIGFVLQSSYTFTLAAGTTQYAMPTDFMATLNVWYRNPTGQFRKLEATSFNQLDSNMAAWRGAGCGTPQSYYIDMGSQTVMMGTFPCPNSTSTGTVLMYYAQQSQDLTATTGTPFNGKALFYPYASALADYVTMRGYWTLEQPDLAKPFEDRWNSFLTIIKQGVMRQPDFNPGVAGRRNE